MPTVAEHRTRMTQHPIRNNTNGGQWVLAGDGHRYGHRGAYARHSFHTTLRALVPGVTVFRVCSATARHRGSSRRYSSQLRQHAWIKAADEIVKSYEAARTWASANFYLQACISLVRVSAEQQHLFPPRGNCQCRNFLCGLFPCERRVFFCKS